MRLVWAFLCSLGTVCTFRIAPPLPPKKTILDTGKRFVKHTYFRHEDISVASSSSPENGKACAVVLPGADMSGLSVYPHVVALSQKMRTYTFVSGDRRMIDMQDMVRCVCEFIDKNLEENDVTIIGESCGAIVAINSMKILQRSNARIKRLVLLNPATGFWNIPDPKKTTKNIVDTFAVMKHSPRFSDISTSIEGLMTQFPDTKTGHVLVYFYMLYNEFVLCKRGKRYRVTNWIGTSKESTMECMKKHMGIETVLLLGEKDGIIPQEKGLEVFRRNVKNLVVHWVPGGTHLLTPNLVSVVNYCC